MYTMRNELAQELEGIRADGLYKDERVMTTPQSGHIATTTGPALNFCANNYLGLANDPRVVAAAKEALDQWGFGMSSVRFICGTQSPHRTLERAIADWLGYQDTILFSSCFDANGAIFDVLLTSQDAIISDELNHASIIDGVRLSKAARHRYRNRNLDDLRARLQETRDARHRIIATDGVFSMDGYVAPLDDICTLADEYNALVMVDDSHAVGFVGETGAGTPERFGVAERIDIITGTLGKALGGASGGYTCARTPIVELLRQRSRPYLFSNSLAPSIVAATLAALGLLSRSGELLERLRENTTYFRTRMAEEGFEIPESDHPIAPVMIGDAVLAARMADAILARGVYVRAFSYPVVPKGRARIRTQLSASLTREDLDTAIRAFVEARSEVR